MAFQVDLFSDAYSVTDRDKRPANLVNKKKNFSRALFGGTELNFDKFQYGDTTSFVNKKTGSGIEVQNQRPSSKIALKKLAQPSSGSPEESKNVEKSNVMDSLRKRLGIGYDEVDEYGLDKDGLTGRDRMKILQMYQEGYSEKEIQAEIQKMKKRNQVVKQRKKEVANFKATVKASNGLTYNQAMAIKDKYLSRYHGVGVVWEMPTADSGHYRRVTEEEMIESLNLTPEERAEWERAKAAIAELEQKLAQMQSEQMNKVIGNNV